QGDAQEYFVHLFEDLSKRTPIKYEVNPLNHLDLWGIPVLILAGWGWSKRRVEVPGYFPTSPLAACFIPLSGVVANFALVGILSTLYLMLPFSLLEVAIAINIQIAFANLMIPIPPLALGRALVCPFQLSLDQQFSVDFLGKLVILALVVAEYTMHWPLFRPLIMKPSSFVLEWVLRW
ncbi:MAG: hypothetical protein RBS57_12420, partial [Desulforhabdus sp.]|nr:hypothetical protein [Desulforhabdus sp.]